MYVLIFFIFMDSEQIMGNIGCKHSVTLIIILFETNREKKYI